VRVGHFGYVRPETIAMFSSFRYHTSSRGQPVWIEGDAVAPLTLLGSAHHASPGDPGHSVEDFDHYDISIFVKTVGMERVLIILLASPFMSRRTARSINSIV